ncbi:MAG: IS1182 family transposase [Acidobacteria bacterium]|nr:IS1182 family transposase [Acidobacteriota bacterium]
MSLTPSIIEPVPEQTVLVARAAFPKGNLYLSMRDEFGTLFEDADFAELFSRRGHPAFTPWRLALITIMQFLENLSDRQAAEAVRSRIDWKYLLGLELTDSGFDYSVLSGFRSRLVVGEQQTLLLERLLDRFREKKLLKVRGHQRTDSTHVLAAIRVMNRLELVTETMRAALNEVAASAPEWLTKAALPEWLARYATRAEQSRMPRTDPAREDYARQVGEDGFYLLKLLSDQQPALLKLEKVAILDRVWQRHYTRREDGEVNWRPTAELAKAATAVESPYDTDARFSTKRDLSWTGYKVHLSETCDEHLPRLITNVHTTAATTQDVSCTNDIHKQMQKNNLLPSRHLVDTGYMDAELVVGSSRKYGIELFGPMRLNPSWQARERGIDAAQFQIDWDNRQARCPMGKQSAYWSEYQTREYSTPVVKIRFKPRDCAVCVSRKQCVRSKKAGRSLQIPGREMYEALEQTRRKLLSEEGRNEYRKRAGIEGTISQGVRRGTLRRSRYSGLEKTHLQEVATATAINIVRAVNYSSMELPAKTRVSRFARLAN